MSPAFPPHSYDMSYMPTERDFGNSSYSTLTKATNPVQSRPVVACADLSKPPTPQESFDWEAPFEAPFVDVIHTASNGSDNDQREAKASQRTDDWCSPLDVFCEPSPEDASQALEALRKKRLADPSDTKDTSLRRKKKPKSLPKRPLSAYNLYFQHMRANLNKSEDTKLGFDELGKIVGKKWKLLPEDERKKFQYLADQDTERYRREMEDHSKREEQKKRERFEQAQQVQLQQSQKVSFPNQHHRYSSRPLYHSSHHPGYGAPHHNPQPSATTHSTSYHQNFSHSVEHYPTRSTESHASTYTQPVPVATTNELRVGKSDDGVDSQVNLHALSKLPAGSEVSLRDAYGELRTYTVQYRMVTMSRQEADEYFANMSQGKS